MLYGAIFGIIPIGDIMEYNNYKCPVCSKPFEKDEDIVVCPECGTPHHRDCYDSLGHCFYEEKHNSNFSFDSVKKENSHDENKVICPVCQKDNPKGNRLCIYCGADLPRDTKDESKNAYTPPFTVENTEETQKSSQPQGTPFPGVVFDPMAGLKGDADVGNSVTVDEVTKFTKNNAPFYARLFSQINNSGRSRFSFVGFIFGGGWLLYRKMYKIGAVITALYAFTIFLSTYLSITRSNFLAESSEQIYNIVYSGGYFFSSKIFSDLGAFFSSMSGENLFTFILYYSMGILQFALRLVTAICGHRWYYKHSIKKINAIKATSGSREKLNASLEEKGGVNLPLAISLMVSYLAIIYLPGLLL